MRQLRKLVSTEFDVLVIGGGATGLGIAVDAASRGFSTALLEARDFASGTSSRSTKLVHGGVRYLEQLDIALVREALHERGIMKANAPHIVGDLAFVVPQYSWWEAPFYGAGLKLYDALAGKLNLAPSRLLGVDAVVAAIPNVSREGLLGGIRYHDGQFDDARMAIALMRTAQDHGATLVNYLRVESLLRKGERVTGVCALDTESGQQVEVRAGVVFNATGIWTDELRKMAEPGVTGMVQPAQGIHLVLPREFLPGDNAIMVPHTDDGRVLFVIPWHDRVLVGTTDTPMSRPEIEPRALPEEVEFVLRNAARYLERDPSRSDVLSVFAGQRPLVRPPGTHAQSKEISRTHFVGMDSAGMVTIAGGKWTTYRRMAEDALSFAIEHGLLERRKCITEQLSIHGATGARSLAAVRSLDEWRTYYGTDGDVLAKLEAGDPELAAKLHPALPYARSTVIFAVREEMARNVEDVLARRTRSLLLDCRASMECAQLVAEMMAREMGRDQAWVADQVIAFHELARGYLLTG